ncbi:hypothetical protein LTR49_028799 [Elasticomyces elasticus]|nr:hypothetical protein LTR49_028799 [Elasticomyces elasticus]
MTRNKRPTSTSAALPAASVKRMVTSLEIDAHPALSGSSLARQNNGQEEEKDVYRWHGTLYKRQGDEPVDWVKEHDEKAAERKKAIETKVKRAAGLKGRTEKRKRDEECLPPEPPRPHKKGKPRNLLAPTASKHQAISTESNALVSKLLGLPPEIRTRIWC